MKFAWTSEKEQDNITKHGINFTDAVQIFRDPRRIERHDDDSSNNEDRWQTIGLPERYFLLFILKEVTIHV